MPMDDSASQARRWDLWASHYDSETPIDPEPAADLLQQYAKGGRALELGAGTGRIALALARRGVTVDGLEISPKMAEKLTQNTGDLPVRAIVGDMADIPLTGPYDLVYTVYSTIFSLLTQQEQISCFRNTARVLAPGGVSVLECMIPSMGGLLADRQQLAIRDLSDGHLSLSATTNDPATQRVIFQEVRITEHGTRMLPVHIRYIWPAEMDLMAQLAGMRLRQRTGGWDGSPFHGSSRHHVSVYQLAAP
jgi:SAM-dependent methyltransferase